MNKKTFSEAKDYLDSILYIVTSDTYYEAEEMEDEDKQAYLGSNLVSIDDVLSSPGEIFYCHWEATGDIQSIDARYILDLIKEQTQTLVGVDNYIPVCRKCFDI